MKFTKMHGIGNDYIYINAITEKIENPSELAIKLSAYHFGVGSDGLILIMESDKADFRMRMFNSDGSEAEMCGNGLRCVAKFVYDKGLTTKTEFDVETGAGIRHVVVHVKDGEVETVTLDMGAPILKPALIPTSFPGEDPIINKTLTVGENNFSVTCVSMGNPHCIIFTEKVALTDVKRLGSSLERCNAFPKGANIEFAEIVDDSHIKMRVWERGSGETLACGTGACATLVAAHLNNLCGRHATLHLLGGDLHIVWNENDNHIYMTGPATIVYEGTIK